MASIYDLKPAFQGSLRPLVRGLARAGVTANAVTVFAMLLSIAGGAWLTWQPGSRTALAAIPAILLVRMALNAIDGMLAREHDMKSRLGAVLNELGDVVSDAALYLPFAFVPGLPPALIVGCVLLAWLTEMAGAVAVQVGASRRYDGPMGKSDRALVFGLVALLIASGIQPGNWSTVVLAIMLFLLAVTVLNRARRALAEAAR